MVNRRALRRWWLCALAALVVTVQVVALSPATARRVPKVPQAKRPTISHGKKLPKRAEATAVTAAAGVTLAVDRRVIAAGQKATLTATVSGSIAPPSIKVVDRTTGTTLKKCNLALKCVTTAVFYTGGPHRYVATTTGLSPSTSAPATVTRKPWQVSLSTDEPVFLAGDRVTMSAAANQSVGATAGHYAFYIVDKVTDRVVGSCQPLTTRTSCTADNIEPDSTRDYNDFTALIAAAGVDTSDQADITDVQATSATLSMKRAPFALTLTTNTPAPEVGDSVQLTATANQTVIAANVGSYIFDTRSKALVQSCLPSDYEGHSTIARPRARNSSARRRSSAGPRSERSATSDEHESFGTVCTAYRDFFKDLPAPAQYIAVIAAIQDRESGDISLDSVTDVLATSNTVTVTPRIFTLALVASAPGVGSDDTPVTLTATANQDVSRAGYSIYIVDPVRRRVLKECRGSSLMTCETAVTFRGMANQFAAIVTYHYSYQYEDLPEPSSVFEYAKFTSNRVSVDGAPLTISLVTDNPVFNAGDNVGFQSEVNNDLKSTQLSDGYLIYLIDKTTDTIVYTCSPDYSDSVCGFGRGSVSCRQCRLFADGGPHVYQSLIATSDEPRAATPEDLQNVQARSNLVTVSRAPWQIQLTASSYAYDDGTYLTAEAETNQDWFASYNSGGYDEIIVDYTTGQITPNLPDGGIFECCTYGFFFPWSTPQPHAIVALIAKYDPANNTYYDVQASSNVVVAPAVGGASASGETTGGSNPSEANCQSCHGDPINTFTGAYLDTVSDLGIPGRGPALSLARTYDSSAAAADGPLGHGWAFAYNAHLDLSATNGPDGLPRSVTVVQENGSTAAFVATPTGDYLPTARVTAALTRDADHGTWTLTRKGGERLEFNAAGALTALRDPNGNTTALTYDSSGHLTRAAASGNRTLTFSWSSGHIDTVTDSAGRKATYSYDSAGNLTAVTGIDGGVTHYAYDAANHLVQSTTPTGAVTSNTYDSDTGRVTAQTDPAGGRTTFAYQGTFPTITTTTTDADRSITTERYVNAQLVAKTVGASTSVAASWAYTYDANNNLASITDPTGATQSYRYDTVGNKLTSTDALQRTTTWTYDALGNVLKATAADGTTTVSTYDAAGNQLSVTTPSGRRQRFTYNTDGTKASATDPAGNTTSFSYDPAGDLTSQTDAAGHTTTFDYDPAGRATKVADPTGAVTTTTYDGSGHVLTVTDPAGDKTTNTYDADGNELTVTDPLSRVTATTYDANGRRLTTKDPSGAVTTYHYTPGGDLASVTDPDGHRQTYAYDARHNLTSKTDAAGHTTSYLYDGDSRIVGTTSPANAVTTTTYDAAGQITKTVDANSHATTYAYSDTGQLTTQTDALARTTRTAYTKDGQPSTITQPDGSTTEYRYTDDGHLASYTDPDGHTTSYTYDATGHRTKTVRPGARTTGYTYDDAGRLTATTLPNNDTVTNTYDSSGQLTKRGYSDTDTHPVTYTYDAAGQRTTMTDATGTTTYSYDQNGRLSTTTNGAGAHVGYTRDPAGLLTKLSYPSNQDVTYTYDAANHMTKATDWTGHDYTFGYNDDGALTTLTDPNGATETTTVNPLGQPTSIKLTSDQNTLTTLGYSYNAANELTGDTTALGNSRSYTYDQTSQLATSQVTTAGANPGPVRSYTASSGGMLSANAGTTLRYDQAGQLTSGSTQAGASTTYRFDANGARTTQETTDGTTDPAKTNYTYTDDGSLTAVTTPTGTRVSYTYDGDGLRQTRTTAGATSTFTWATDGALPILLDDGTHRYVYGPTATPIADFTTATGAVQYLHHDATGSVTAITNPAGSLTAKIAYSPFGTSTETGISTSRIGFAGEWTDPDTGLVYLRARDYDPDTGQFLTVDPLVDDTHQPYTYADNNPLQKTDPTGLFFGEDFLTSGIGGDIVGFFEGVGNAATFGLAERFDELVSPGSSCQFNRNGFYQAGEVLGTVASAALLGGSGSLVERGTAAVRQLADSGLARARSVLARLGRVARNGTEEAEHIRRSTLFRAVGQHEADDIIASGGYRNAAGLEGKYFFQTQEQAERYGQMMNKVPGFGAPNFLTSGSVPTTALGSAEAIEAGSEGPGLFFRGDLSEIANVQIHGLIP